MYSKISFCVGNKTVEVNGQTYSLGEITADCLNISPDEFDTIRGLNESAKKLCGKYGKSRDLADWFAANEEFLALEELLCSHKVFRALSDPDDNLLYEARQFTQQLSLLPETDTSPTDSDYEILGMRLRYQEYLESPEEFDEDEIPETPPELPRSMLILPGSTRDKWKFYRERVKVYDDIILDLLSFNNTMFTFIRHMLSKLTELNPNNYAMALNAFLYGERSYKYIANPVSGTGLFTDVDYMEVRHIPRETYPSSGDYKIYDYYTAERLQGLLKTDFYGALEEGYVIRQCEFCGRYFLLKDARHTKYCDRRYPEFSNASCATLGYRFKGVKEASGDDPRAASMRRLLMRIDKDLAKKAITYEEMERVIAKAKDLYHDASLGSSVSYDDFDKMLQSENIYKLCDVTRRAKPRGRPKKVKADE